MHEKNDNLLSGIIYNFDLQLPKKKRKKEPMLLPVVEILVGVGKKVVGH